MKAIIIYDDFEVAIKARSALARSLQQHHLAIEWHISPWSAKILTFSAAAIEALNDAADAHLIVFAGVSTGPRTPWLHDWMERWVRLRQVKDPILAVVVADDAGDISLSSSPDIARFAWRHGLNCLSDASAVSMDTLEFLPVMLPGREPSAATATITSISN